MHFEDLQLYSRPSAGKTMLGLLKKYGIELHKAHLLLIEEFERNYKITGTEWVDNMLFFKRYECSTKILERERNSLICSSLILNWICGRILNQISFNSNLLDAEMWFDGSLKESRYSNFISPDCQKLVIGFLKKINFSELLDVLPYLAEVFETGNETPDEKGVQRRKKKTNGIYYTPTDVIDFIVSHTIDIRKESGDLIKNAKWYDPALGTGSFLLGVLRYYSSLKTFSGNDREVDFFERNLYGTDVSPHALLSATYIIATSCLKKSTGGNLKQVAKIIGNNLALIDATRFLGNSNLSDAFPTIENEGVDFIISNPPYSRKQQPQLNLFENGLANTMRSSEELYPEFVKMLLELPKKENCGGGMVVPLSIVASSKDIFKTLRRNIQNKKGVMEFWNFDRTPDSLFGDDVKTRNTIFFFNTSNAFLERSIVGSTYLHRWNSRKRKRLFDTISITELNEGLDIADGVPKVGDSIGVDILTKIKQTNSGNLTELLQVSQHNSEILTKPTAYNWLPIELNIADDQSQLQGKIRWGTKSKYYSAPAIYAVLNSRLTYWLWRVFSDGFHLTNQFIYNLPFGKQFVENIDELKLSKLGLKLWNEAKEEPILTKNAGIESISYCPLRSVDVLNEIDQIVLGFFGFSSKTENYLKTFIHQLIVAGREDEASTFKKMNYIEPINIK